MEESRKRIYILDIIRGVLIIYVVYYHFMYDLNDIIGYEIPYLYSDWFSKIRNIMSGSLIFISGISCNFSRNNIRRGAKTLLIALLLSIVTLIAMPSQTIIFGILHLLGVMMTLYGLAELDYANYASRGKRTEKAWSGKMPFRAAFMCVFLILFAVSRNIYYGTVGVGSISIKMPKALYGNFFMYIVGFGGPYFSADYYPLIPWGFLFLAGTMAGFVFKKEKLPRFLYKNFCRPLAFIGRHTMIIYLVHQPLLLGISMLAAQFMH